MVWEKEENDDKEICQRYVKQKPLVRTSLCWIGVSAIRILIALDICEIWKIGKNDQIAVVISSAFLLKNNLTSKSYGCNI